MKKLRFIYPAILFCWIFSYFTFAQNFSRPAGIYALSPGTRQPMPRLGNIRDYSFVDGYAWRVGWIDFETDSAVYDFSPIDSAVSTLQALNQKLTITLFAKEIPPDILYRPEVLTYYAQVSSNSSDSILTAVPWDSTALSRWDSFCRALGNHRLPDAALGGDSVALRDHSVLKQLNCSIVGLGGIRDLGNRLVNSAHYNRSLFINGSLRSIQSMLDQFTDKFSCLAIFGIVDGQQPSLRDVLIDSFLTRFNGVSHPRLGFFQENLACAGPGYQNNPLYLHQDTTFTMFQMLQSWRNPFRNPPATDSCRTDTTGPDVGMLYGLNNFGCRYFEIYVADLDWPGYNGIFQYWHDFLGGLTSVDAPLRDAILPLSFHLDQNYPNPFNPTTRIKFGLPKASDVIVDVYNILGQRVATVFNGRKPAGYHIVELDASRLASGVYIYRMKAGDFKAAKKLLLLK